MNNLLRLIGNRLIWLPIMIFGVTVLVFFLMSLSPIDPAFSALGENASPDQLEAYRVEHGLNDPLIVRYGDYMAGFFHGDLGTFGPSNQSVSARIATALGMKQMASMFIRGMEQVDPELPHTPYDGHDLFPDQMRSAEFCTKPCVGCEYARGTGNNWWHVCEKQLAD